MNTEIGRLVFIGIQAVQRKPVMAALRRLEATQFMSAEELRRLQAQRLTALLRFVSQRVPHYRRALAGYPLAEPAVDPFEALRRLPPLPKSVVRDSGDELHAERPGRRIYYETTSGSTGLPVRFGRDGAFSGENWAAAYRGRRWFGVDVGAPVGKIIVRSIGRVALAGRIANWLRNEAWWSADHMSAATVRDFYRRCLRLRPTYFYGYPSHMVRLADALGEMRLSARDIGLKLVVTTGEELQDQDRTQIETAFGAPVANEYGSRDAGVIAFACPQGRLHITAENVYLELLDEEAPAPGLRRGELLVTPLCNFAMPLLRYRLGDIVTLSDAACPCGRGLPLLERVEGRVASVISTASGELVTSFTFNRVVRSVLERGGDIRECQFVQRRPGAVVARVVRGPRYDDRTTRLLIELLHAVMGASAIIELEFVSRIETPASGKRLLVVSDIRR